MQQHDMRQRNLESLLGERQPRYEQFRDEGGCHESGQQDRGSQAHKEHIENQARETPGLSFTALCLVAQEDGKKGGDQRTTGDQVKERIRQAKGREVGCGLWARAKKHVQEHLPQEAEQLRGNIGRREEQRALRDAEAAQREARSRQQTRGAEAKGPVPPVTAQKGWLPVCRPLPCARF